MQSGSHLSLMLHSFTNKLETPDWLAEISCLKASQVSSQFVDQAEERNIV